MSKIKLTVYDFDSAVQYLQKVLFDWQAFCDEHKQFTIALAYVLSNIKNDKEF